MRKNEENAAHIVYASDDGFAEIMGISILSLFENSKDMEEIIIYILDSKISEKNKNRIESVCKQYERQIPVWIPAKEISKELNMSVAADRGSQSQYARLFLSGILPQDIEKVLYLDCDIIINHSLYELWKLDLGKHSIAALMDAFSRHYRKNIGLRPEDIMFNSGVMLIDLKRWKEQKTEQKLLEFITFQKGKIQQGDQGALNAVLSHETLCFEPRFNSVTIFYDFTYKEMLRYRKPPKFYSEGEIERAVTEPVIIHFTTSFLSKRPWEEGCKHRYIKEWMKYKSISPWKNEPLRICKKDNGLRGIVIQIIRKFPRKYVILISGIVQAYGRPLTNRLVNK